MKLLTALGLLALLLFACSDDTPTGSGVSESLMLSLSFDEYSLDDTVVTLIINYLEHDVNVPACCADIEVLVERFESCGCWMPFTYPSICPAICSIGITLESGDRRKCTPYFTPTEPGEYRFKLHYYYRIDSTMILDTTYSRPFTVSN